MSSTSVTRAGLTRAVDGEEGVGKALAHADDGGRYHEYRNGVGKPKWGGD